MCACMCTTTVVDFAQLTSVLTHQHYGDGSNKAGDDDDSTSQ